MGSITDSEITDFLDEARGGDFVFVMRLKRCAFSEDRDTFSEIVRSIAHDAQFIAMSEYDALASLASGKPGNVVPLGKYRA